MKNKKKKIVKKRKIKKVWYKRFENLDYDDDLFYLIYKIVGYFMEKKKKRSMKKEINEKKEKKEKEIKEKKEINEKKEKKRKELNEKKRKVLNEKSTKWKKK